MIDFIVGAVGGMFLIIAAASAIAMMFIEVVDRLETKRDRDYGRKMTHDE